MYFEICLHNACYKSTLIIILVYEFTFFLNYFFAKLLSLPDLVYYDLNFSYFQNIHFAFTLNFKFIFPAFAMFAYSFSTHIFNYLKSSWFCLQVLILFYRSETHFIFMLKSWCATKFFEYFSQLTFSFPIIYSILFIALNAIISLPYNL